jgi:hypothetical protein
MIPPAGAAAAAAILQKYRTRYNAAAMTATAAWVAQANEEAMR